MSWQTYIVTLIVDDRFITIGTFIRSDHAHTWARRWIPAKTRWVVTVGDNASLTPDEAREKYGVVAMS